MPSPAMIRAALLKLLAKPITKPIPQQKFKTGPGPSRFVEGAETLEEKGFNQFQRATIEEAEVTPGGQIAHDTGPPNVFGEEDFGIVAARESARGPTRGSTPTGKTFEQGKDQLDDLFREENLCY